jgi:hypothetical protein
MDHLRERLCDHVPFVTMTLVAAVLGFLHSVTGACSAENGAPRAGDVRRARPMLIACSGADPKAAATLLYVRNAGTGIERS